ncbi:MAG: hypothetical protein GX087_00435 [Desulfobulbaceae bacterium]|nr:hypothetical protein [Desulfobulbaceae bacterium]
MAYLLLFLAVLVEGPIATLAAATLAAKAVNDLSIGIVVLVAIGGNLAADFLWYFLGRFGKGRLSLRLLPGSTQLNRGRILTVQTHLRDHGLWYFVAAKLSLGLAMVPVLLAMGMAKVALPRLLPVAIVCEIVWTGALALAGYYGMGPILTRILESESAYIHWGAAGTAVMVILAFFLWKWQGGTKTS